MTRNLAAIAVIVALIVGDLVLLGSSARAPVQSWAMLWPYLLTGAALTALSVYAVLKNDRKSR